MHRRRKVDEESCVTFLLCMYVCMVTHINSRSCQLRIDYLIEKMNEVHNGDQKEQKYFDFKMFYGGQKLHKYFRSLLIKETSLLTC